MTMAYFQRRQGKMKRILISVSGAFNWCKTILFRNGTQHTAGVSGGKNSAGNVVGHYTAGSDDTAVSNGDTAANSSIGTDPHIIFQCDGGGRANAFSSLGGIHGMSRAGEADTGADEGIGTDMHRRGIQNDAVVIDDGQTVGVDMEAVITVERWLNECQGMAGAEKLL